MNLEKFLRENDAKIQTQADKNADHVFSSKSDWYKDDMWNNFLKDVVTSERQHKSATNATSRCVVGTSTI